SRSASTVSRRRVHDAPSAQRIRRADGLPRRSGAGAMIIKKILMLGEIGVGKTSISRRLLFSTFGDSCKATIGVDIYTYDVKPDPEGLQFKFLIWDTDGSHGDGIFRQYFARQAQAAMIVSDVTRPSSVESMLQLGRQYADIMPG